MRPIKALTALALIALIALAAGSAPAPSLAQDLPGATPIDALAPLPDDTPGCATAGGEVGGGAELGAATSLSTTYIIQPFAPLAPVAPISTTHTLRGDFPSLPYFTYCATGRQVSFSSTGGACTLDANNRRIDCPSSISSFTYRYLCSNNGFRLGRFHTITPSFTTSYDVDAAITLRYPSYMRLVSATPAPKASAAGYLYWEQPNTRRAAVSVVLEDTRVRAVFVPLLRR